MIKLLSLWGGALFFMITLFYSDKPPYTGLTPLNKSDRPATTEVQEIPPSTVYTSQTFTPKETPKKSNTSTVYSRKKHLSSLLQQALLAKSNQNFTQSIEIYNQIIALLEGSQDPKELKLYAQTHFLKAAVLEHNLNHSEEAFKTYTNLVKKFENLSNPELLKIITKAQLYQASMVGREDSLAIYDTIIERFKQSDDPKLLKNYVMAQFAKSYTLKNGQAIAVYDEMIQKLSQYDDKELLLQLYQAQSNKAYILEHSLNDRESALQVYDRIIERFDRYEDEEYQEIVERALFSKSFLFMDGQNEHKAMQIFDTLIDRYQETGGSEVPKNIEYAIINNIELALILGGDDSHYHELANTYLTSSQESQPQIEMLEILKNAQEFEQDEMVEIWKSQYTEFHFQNWSFEQLKQWNNQMEESVSKERIRHYLDTFEQHNKYKKDIS